MRVAGYEVFTTPWADAWREALNASEGFRRAASTWNGAVALVMHADGATGITAQRAVFLDLLQGACRSARVATEGDLHAATFVFEASADTWRDLLGTRASPLMAIMTGRLSLTRGSLAALLPYASAANELVATASRVESLFPDTT
jgi:putative sterol carrier protein